MVVGGYAPIAVGVETVVVAAAVVLVLDALGGGLVGGTYGYPSVYQKLYEAQTKVIQDLAEKESCVIVGRCADYILRDRGDCLHIFIHADNEHRSKHILEKYGPTDKSTAQRIKDKDNRRRNYYRFHTDRDWGVANNYHLSLDSGVLGEETCVEIILKAMED